jgi:hypothetical protein
VNLLDSSSATCTGQQSGGQAHLLKNESDIRRSAMLRRTVIRDLPDRSRIVVHLELREDGDHGSLSPAFSVTADLFAPHGTHSGRSRHLRGREPDALGSLHDDVLAACPELAPLVALHLADPATGEPMHAGANGLYFYRAARGLGGWTDQYGQAERAGLTAPEYARRLACSALRVEAIPLDDVAPCDLAAAFARFVDAQRPRWASEAQAGRALIQALPTVEEQRGYDLGGRAVEREGLA